MISEVLLDLISRVDSIHSEKKGGGGGEQRLLIDVLTSVCHMISDKVIISAERSWESGEVYGRR